MVAFARSSGAEEGVPFRLPPPQELNRIQSAVIKTSRGDLYFDLFPKSAPWHVANFKYLADRGFYRKSKFHIFQPGYIIQGGGKPGHPSSGPGYTLPPEFGNSQRHLRGTLGMARMADQSNVQRRSDGSQFHILLSDAPHMDGSFTIFGKLVAGDTVLSELQRGDTIEDVIVYVKR